MATKPKAYTIVCNKCRWQQTWCPTSDMLPAIAKPECCPNCQQPDLHYRSATLFEEWLDGITC